jgi:hypothetical protein
MAHPTPRYYPQDRPTEFLTAPMGVPCTHKADAPLGPHLIPRHWQGRPGAFPPQPRGLPWQCPPHIPLPTLPVLSPPSTRASSPSDPGLATPRRFSTELDACFDSALLPSDLLSPLESAVEGLHALPLGRPTSALGLYRPRADAHYRESEYSRCCPPSPVPGPRWLLCEPKAAEQWSPHLHSPYTDRTAAEGHPTTVRPPWTRQLPRTRPLTEHRPCPPPPRVVQCRPAEHRPDPRPNKDTCKQPDGKPDVYLYRGGRTKVLSGGVALGVPASVKSA